MDSKLLMCAFAVLVLAAYSEAAGDCPLASKVYSCSPRCEQNFDCSNGRVCCPNSCNTKSCSEPDKYGGSGANDKYNSNKSGGSGIYCNNVKCNSYEVCQLDRATNKRKCMRP